MITAIKKIETKYSGMSDPMKTSVWFILCSIVQKGIVFLTTPFFTRIMSQNEYGVVSIYHSWLGILTIIATLQMSTGVFNKAMIKYEHERDSYTSSTLVLSSLSITIVAALYFVFRVFLKRIIDLPLEFMILLFVEMFFTNAMSMYTIRERFEYRYKSVVVLTFLANALATVVSLIFVIHIDYDKAFLRVLGTVIVHVIFYTIAFYRIFRRSRTGFRKNYWKYAVNYNLPLIPHYLSQQILNSSDRIMINNMTGSSNAAIYSLAYQVAVVVDIVTSAIHATFMPWTFQKIHANQTYSIGKRALQIVIMMGGICVLFSLFAPEFILILGGRHYYEAVYIIPPVSMSVMFSMMYSFFANIEYYFEKSKFVMVASVSVALSNIILNAIFIPVFGYVAAGYTTLFCYIGYCFAHYLFMLRVCKEKEFKNPYPTGKMWSIAIIYAVVSIFISFFYKYGFIRYIIIVSIMLIIGLYFKKNKSSIIGK